MSDDLTMTSLKEAWGAGYQGAVDSLREMLDEFGNEQSKALIRVLIITLQEIKPP